jgi:transcriptional regulator with XRE-family HTH domain
VVQLARLRAIRERNALSQQELAEKARVSRGTIIRLEGGGEAPYPSTVRKLAQALNVQPSDLMNGGNQAHASTAIEITSC